MTRTLRILRDAGLFLPCNHGEVIFLGSWDNPHHCHQLNRHSHRQSTPDYWKMQKKKKKTQQYSRAVHAEAPRWGSDPTPFSNVLERKCRFALLQGVGSGEILPARNFKRGRRNQHVYHRLLSTRVRLTGVASHSPYSPPNSKCGGVGARALHQPSKADPNLNLTLTASGGGPLADVGSPTITA